MCEDQNVLKLTLYFKSLSNHWTTANDKDTVHCFWRQSPDCSEIQADNASTRAHAGWSTVDSPIQYKSFKGWMPSCTVEMGSGRP